MQHFSGLDEAVFRNIKACKELSRVTRSSYGPNGMNKMVINHLEKLFVTNDAATIIKELEVQHPAAKMIVMATKMMEQEVGYKTEGVTGRRRDVLTVTGSGVMLYHKNNIFIGSLKCKVESLINLSVLLEYGSTRNFGYFN